jgi:hypothetical protein
MFVCREKANGENSAVPAETAGDEIGAAERPRKTHRRGHHGRSSLCLGKIGLREIDDYDVSSYKLAQASSSSGREPVFGQGGLSRQHRQRLLVCFRQQPKKCK